MFLEVSTPPDALGYAPAVQSPQRMTNDDDEARFADASFGDLLAQIAARTPAPGGGAVASAVGALGAALGSMVVAYSVGKKSLAAHQAELERSAAQLERARTLMLELAASDMRAYALLNELQRLPEDDARRIAEWDAAALACVQTPRALVALAMDLLRLCESLVPITNVHLRSDLAIAAVLAEACARSGAWNVRINLSLVKSPEERGTLEAEIASALADASARCKAIEVACAV